MAKTESTTLTKEDLKKIQPDTLSTAVSTEGIQPNSGFFSRISTIFGQVTEIGSKLPNWFQNALRTIPFFGAIGATGNIISNLSGAVMGIIKKGSQTINTVAKGTGAVVAATGSLAVGIALQTVTGVTLPQMLRGLLNFGDTVYNFNFDMPDSAIYKQIEGIINGLYGAAGDFLGSSFARLILMGTLEPPRVEIDVRGIALAYSEYADDKRRELLQGVSSFAMQGINAAKRISFLFAFLKGRQAVKDAIKALPELQKVNPSLLKFVNEWGDEENPNTKENEVKDWRISTWVENKIESIPDPRIRDFVENFVESFGDELRDGLEDWIDYKYT